VQEGGCATKPDWSGVEKIKFLPLTGVPTPNVQPLASLDTDYAKTGLIIWIRYVIRC
jgi:hypothetical protein